MSTLVTFKQDVFPYTRGDVVKLDREELARVDSVIKARNLEDAYVKGAKELVETVDSPADADRARSAEARTSAKENDVETAATLQAQRDSVAEPANVDALGVKAETSQVVTGNKPVEGVEVENPQEVTDVGSDADAEVKTTKPKK